jgi:glycosyltransferase involved in cell wall biosynthesis
MNKGGTVGYLSSLLDGMQKAGTFTSPNGLRHAFMFPDIGPNDRVPNISIETLKYDSPFSIAYEDSYHLKFFDRRDWFHQTIPLSEALKVNLKKITSIHIHGTYNFLPIYNMLRLAGIENDVKIILTTHNPWKPELEDLFHFNKAKTPEEIQRDLPKEAAFKYHMQLRDDFAFRMSDVLFFPSEHSMDGYYESWPEFADIVKNKPVYFSVTGTEPKEVSLPRKAMRSSLGIPENAYVFLHLGRFIPMRGFDLFEEVAERILHKHPNAYFVAVGQEREKPSVKHSRWIEVGHTNNPGDFLNMADACVMANRGSYFDLSMIEALAQGIHLITAKVGGYKYLENRTKGVTYFETGSSDDLFRACDEFCLLDKSQLDSGKRDNLKLYRDQMTPEKFAQGYFDTIDRMYLELGIEKKERNIANKLGLASYPNPALLEKKKKSTVAEIRPIQNKPSPDLNHRFLEQKGIELHKKGLFKNAIDIFSSAVEHELDTPRIRRLLAESLISAGFKKEAIHHLKIARKHIPNNKNLKSRLLKIKYGTLMFWVEEKPFI